jgi:hypothetical protein
MKKLNYLLLLISVGLTVSAVRATTVIPPTFDELVDQADVIFQGEVTNVKSEWVGEGAQRHIMSYVTFKVSDSLKGEAGQSYTMRMLGGTVDGESMGVSDAPAFEVGDKDILFVQNNGSQFIPLVGIMHGRFHVRKNQAGQEVVTDHQDAPVRNVSRLGKAEAMELPNEVDLTPADFKAAVRSKLEVEARLKGLSN